MERTSLDGSGLSVRSGCVGCGSEGTRASDCSFGFEVRGGSERSALDSS